MRRRFHIGRSSPAMALVAALVASACRRHGPVPSTVRVVPARVFRVSDRAQLVPGRYAAGRIGDFVLENRFVRAVVDDIPEGGGFALSGGQLVDLATVDGVDELGQVFNFLGRFPRQLRYDAIRIETAPDGRASIAVSGNDPRTPGLIGTTIYSLGPDDHAITLVTTLRNNGTTPTEVGLGDAIQWSGAEHWIPGLGFHPPRASEEPYVAGVGRETAYAYVAARSLVGPNGTNWSNPTQGNATLAPGEARTYERRIGVAARPDVERALEAAGRPHPEAAVTVRVRDENGVPLPRARVVLHDERQGGAPRALASTDRNGEAHLAVDAGRYAIEVAAAGRVLAASSSALLVEPLTLVAHAHPRIDLSVGPRSTLTITLHQEHRPITGRLLVTGVDGTPDPLFDGIGHAEGARNSVVIDASGSVDIPLAPGRYHVVATHGPAFDLPDTVVELTAGSHVSYAFETHRVLAQLDEACGDFHVHQSSSLDAPVSLRDRVRAAAAEGLDVIAATDHNVATDLAPAVHEEHLDDVLLTIVGDEISTDAALHPAGHWNLYPLAYRAGAPLGGAPDLFELSPRALVMRARAIAPDAIVQVNHPRSGTPTGMFDVVGFDPTTATARLGDMAPTFDALEVWNGRSQAAVQTVMLDWFSLLRHGARITGTANSDSHGIVVQEVGYPRTCFHAGPRGVRPLDVAQVIHALRVERDVVLTNGPTISVSAPGVPRAIGHTFANADGTRLDVHVESADWMPVDALELVHADGRAESLPAVRFVREGGRITGDVSVRVPRGEPFVAFRVRGANPIPVLTDDPAMTPLALTNPVYFGSN